jgi:quinol-cytochrome oxidoreductase complex cytochrome b subunit
MLGVLIFLLMMATAFMGYVLPWGQMSFWGATVITNLFGAIPVIGKTIVAWMWGGFSVDNPTLNRFFSLHFLLPFVIVGVVFLHIWALHVTGSNNPTGIDVKGPQDTVPFHPYYTVKDSFGILIFLILFVVATFFFPNYLGHTDNYIPANPLVTPAHIVPEWYFLPFYAMLRAINFDINPVMILGLVGVVYYGFTVFVKRGDYFDHKNLAALLVGGALAVIGLIGSEFPQLHLPLTGVTVIEAKLGGVLTMFGSIAILFVLPFLDTHPVRSAVYRPFYRIALIILVLATFGLGEMGGMPPDVPLLGPITTTHISQLLTLYYFSFFLVIIPYLNRHEKAAPMPASIHEAVLLKHSPNTTGA